MNDKIDCYNYSSIYTKIQKVSGRGSQLQSLDLGGYIYCGVADECTNFVSSNRLEYGWVYQKLANQ